MKIVICLRSVSGAGKSTFAQLLQSLCENSVICESDNFFIDSKGNYKFDASKLGESRAECRARYIHAINNNVELVIISNTSCRVEDVKYYQEKAENLGYRFFSIVIEKRHEGRNSHNVPIQTIQRQFEQLKNSLKLK